MCTSFQRRGRPAAIAAGSDRPILAGLIVACAAAVGIAWTTPGQDPGAACDVAGQRSQHATEGTVTPEESATDGPRIRVFGVADDRGDISTYFRRHRLAVAPVSGPAIRTDRGWRVGLGYSSMNFGGEDGGPTVVFPHEGVILARGPARDRPPDTDPNKALLLLEAQDSDALTYEWVGCTSPGDSMDWFFDKPELLFEGDGGSPGGTGYRRHPENPRPRSLPPMTPDEHAHVP